MTIRYKIPLITLAISVSMVNVYSFICYTLSPVFDIVNIAYIVPINLLILVFAWKYVITCLGNSKRLRKVRLYDCLIKGSKIVLNDSFTIKADLVIVSDEPYYDVCSNRLYVNKRSVVLREVVR